MIQNICSTSIRPAIVSHPRLNGIVGNASKRPKYCCTTTCRRQLVRCASKRTGIADHRLMNGNARSTSTCPSIDSLQILDSNVGNASKRPSIVGQLLHGNIGNAFKRPSIVGHQLPHGNIANAFKRPSSVGHQLLHGNIGNAFKRPSIVGHQLPHGNIANAFKRPSSVGHQLLHGNIGNAFKRPSIARHQLLDSNVGNTSKKSQKLLNNNLRTATCQMHI